MTPPAEVRRERAPAERVVSCCEGCIRYYMLVEMACRLSVITPGRVEGGDRYVCGAQLELPEL